jgi:hypothetical protein
VINKILLFDERSNSLRRIFLKGSSRNVLSQPVLFVLRALASVVCRRGYKIDNYNEEYNAHKEMILMMKAG